MSETKTLLSLVQAFFQEYLAGQRGLSPNTILAYRDALKLFLAFLAGFFATGFLATAFFAAFAMAQSSFLLLNVRIHKNTVNAFLQKHCKFRILSFPTSSWGNQVGHSNVPLTSHSSVHGRSPLTYQAHISATPWHRMAYHQCQFRERVVANILLMA